VAGAAGGTPAGIAGGSETTIGIINGWEQFGQLTVDPPADWSTASFWPHLGQLNLISIVAIIRLFSRDAPTVAEALERVNYDLCRKGVPRGIPPFWALFLNLNHNLNLAPVLEEA
jgi:hypothetical protein